VPNVSLFLFFVRDEVRKNSKQTVMVISKTFLGIISLLINCFRTKLFLRSPEIVTVMYCTALSEGSWDFGLEEKRK
jgi:hypothetical protein